MKAWVVAGLAEQFWLRWTPLEHEKTILDMPGPGTVEKHGTGGGVRVAGGCVGPDTDRMAVTWRCWVPCW